MVEGMELATIRKAIQKAGTLTNEAIRNGKPLGMGHLRRTLRREVIRGCGLEIEGRTFDIDLILFGSGSFDVIVGMDWLSKHKAEIIFHEKVVRILLRNGVTLRVVGERPEEKVRHLRSAKSKEKKKENIFMVRDFIKEFLDDLSGLPPNRDY
ncbi:putative reverse transcriptase domain-containing protein [Tanacetum coccineum]